MGNAPPLRRRGGSAVLQVSLNITDVATSLAGMSADLPPYTANMWFNVRRAPCGHPQ